jgi:DNA invertase Pin-like site-specific DNA recombinase
VTKSKTKTDYSEFIVTAADLLAAEQSRAESLSEKPATPVRLVLEGEADQLAALLRAMAPPKRCRRLTPLQQEEVYRRALKGETRSALADEFGITRQAVAKMVRRKQQDEESA